MDKSFSVDQVADLKRFGVIDEQIAELEARLPIIERWFEEPIKAGDVRTYLNGIVKALEDVEQALTRASRIDPVRNEGNRRIDQAAFEIDHKSGGDVIAHTLKVVRPALDAAIHARDTAPAKRRYDATTDPQVIRWIYQALSAGWGRKYYSVRDSDTLGAGYNALTPTPLLPEGHLPSRGKTFETIARVVYSVCLGGRDSNPTRAIKAFLAHERQSEDTRRAAMRQGDQIVKASTINAMSAREKAKYFATNSGVRVVEG